MTEKPAETPTFCQRCLLNTCSTGITAGSITIIRCVHCGCVKERRVILS